jgi:hypothetical protein
MYPLPPSFNTLLPPTAIKFNSKNILSEDGLGPRFPDNEYLFNTDQFALEQYFHYRLLHSEYLTNNTDEADFFYIPFYANLVIIARENAPWIFKRFWEHMRNSTLLLAHSRKHVVVYGGCETFAGDFLHHPLALTNLTFVMLERNAHKNKPSNVIVAPYPAQIHHYPDHAYQVDYSKKDILISSTWKSRKPLRMFLARLCMNNSDVCHHDEIKPPLNQSAVYELAARSIFCLQPPGDSATRKGFWDAILVGCINVIYENMVKYPFDDVLDYAKMTIYIPQKAAGKTIQILKNITKEEISAMQYYIDLHREQLQYSVIPEGTTEVPNDAFNMVLKELHLFKCNPVLQL